MPLVPENADNCDDCGQPYAYHEKERVNHGGGQWSWDYVCPTGGE